MSDAAEICRLPYQPPEEIQKKLEIVLRTIVSLFNKTKVVINALQRRITPMSIEYMNFDRVFATEIIVLMSYYTDTYQSMVTTPSVHSLYFFPLKKYLLSLSNDPEELLRGLAFFEEMISFFQRFDCDASKITEEFSTVFEKIFLDEGIVTATKQESALLFPVMRALRNRIPILSILEATDNLRDMLYVSLPERERTGKIDDLHGFIQDHIESDAAFVRGGCGKSMA